MNGRAYMHLLPETHDDEDKFDAELARRERIEASPDLQTVKTALERWQESRRDDVLANLLAQPWPVGLGDRLRFDASRTQPWLIWWPGQRWVADDIKDRHEFLRGRLKAYLAAAPSRKAVQELSYLLDMSKQESVLKSLSTMVPVKVTPDYFDRDTSLLGVRNGVVDLDTGRLRPGEPDDRVSMTTGVAFDPDADCPRFRRYLAEVTETADGQSDDALRDYLARFLGYIVAGGNEEERFAQWVGQGGNGKGKLKDILLHVLGDYAYSAPPTLFMRTRFGAEAESRPNPALLDLRNRRVVFASEPEGGSLNEQRLKLLSGRDEVNGRLLYSNTQVRFRSEAVIVLLTNDLLRVEETDPAIRQRLVMFPFDQAFRGSEREDSGVLDKLKGEAPGILALLVRVAVQYRREHRGAPLLTAAPARVQVAAEAYFDANNPVAPFLHERCIRSAEAGFVSSRDLYEAYEGWIAQQGPEVVKVSSVDFGRKVRQAGVKQGRTNRGKGFDGIRLKTAAELADE